MSPTNFTNTSSSKFTKQGQISFFSDVQMGVENRAGTVLEKRQSSTIQDFSPSECPSELNQSPGKISQRKTSEV